MQWIVKSGLEELLPEMIKTKVYVGISAGSIVTGKSLDRSRSERLYSEEIGPYTGDKGLGLEPISKKPDIIKELNPALLCFSSTNSGYWSNRSFLVHRARMDEDVQDERIVKS